MRVKTRIEEHPSVLRKTATCTFIVGWVEWCDRTESIWDWLGLHSNQNLNLKPKMLSMCPRIQHILQVHSTVYPLNKYHLWLTSSLTLLVVFSLVSSITGQYFAIRQCTEQCSGAAGSGIITHIIRLFKCYNITPNKKSRSPKQILRSKIEKYTFFKTLLLSLSINV